MAEKKPASPSELARKMYLYFISYDARGAPSFEKFARSVGMTAQRIRDMRKHKTFDAAYRECCEIRRDYLIDRGLDKRFDPSLVKHLITTEDEGEAKDSDFTLHLEVSE